MRSIFPMPISFDRTSRSFSHCLSRRNSLFSRNKRCRSSMMIAGLEAVVTTWPLWSRATAGATAGAVGGGGAIDRCILYSAPCFFSNLRIISSVSMSSSTPACLDGFVVLVVRLDDCRKDRSNTGGDS